MKKPPASSIPAFALVIAFTLLAALFLLAPLRATIATSLASFEECEPPQCIYYPLLGGGTFVSESYADSQTNQATGVMRMAVRYRNDATAQGTWWDGDRNTTNTDRQRSESKGLGSDQRTGETFEYSTTWRCNPDLVTTGSSLHFFQLKSTDGSAAGLNDPLVVMGIVATGTAAVSYCSGGSSNHTVVREFPYTPGTWQTITLRVTTSGSTQATGAVQVSVNGDTFTGTSGIPLYRDQATTYQSAWGIYRGLSATAAGPTLGDAFIEHLYPSANPYSETNAPHLLDFRPRAAAVGATLTISEFMVNSQLPPVVTIGGVDAPILPSGNSTGLYVTVPENATSGHVVLRNNNGTVVADRQFTLDTTTPAPVVTGVSPLDAKTNEIITITGTNLTNATVIIGGVRATTTLSGDTTLKAYIPADATSGKVVVSTPGGAVTATQTLNLAPIITDVSPASAKSGATITITGANLTNATVTIGGVAASVTHRTNTTLRVYVPTNATSGPIVVTNPNGSTTAAQTFTRIPTPTVIGVSPSFAQVGDTITLTGTNLGDITAVTIGNVDAPIISNDGTTIKVTVPSGVFASIAISIYIEDFDGASYYAQRIVITPAPSTTIEPHTALVTLAGAPGISGTADGPASTALFNLPYGLVTDRAGNLYIADSGNHVIRRLAPDGQVTTLAGTPGLRGNTDGPAATALFSAPRDLAISPDGATLYIADPGNVTARALNLTTNQVTTLATVELYSYGLATDPAGNLYISDLLGPPGRQRHTLNIIKLDANTGAQTAITGHLTYDSFPMGLTVSPDGTTLYGTAQNLGAIYAINLATKETTFLAGDFYEYGSTDGAPDDARFTSPTALAADAIGNLYITDTSSNLIRKIAADTHTVTTLAGAPNISGSLDGTGTHAQLNTPGGITISDAGDIYIADTDNHTIRVLQVGPAIITQPASQTVPAGSSAKLTVIASGAPNPAYQWFHSGTAITSATTATYSIPAATAANAGDYTVTLTNIMNTVTSVPATLTVTPSPSTGDNNSGGNGGGGGGAPSLSWLAAIAVMLSLRLRRCAK